MKLGTARLIMFVTGGVAALLLGHAHVRVENGSLAGTLIVAALAATIWPRRLAIVVALLAAVITPIYVLASLVAFDVGVDAEEVAYTPASHLGLIAIACAIIGVGAIVVRIGTRSRPFENPSELG